jgi:hypothetical protein
MTGRGGEKKNVFCNAYFLWIQSIRRKRGERKGKTVSDRSMEIPGFYYGIFIKYLSKLYKEDIYLFKYIHPR